MVWSWAGLWYSSEGMVWENQCFVFTTDHFAHQRNGGIAWVYNIPIKEINRISIHSEILPVQSDGLMNMQCRYLLFSSPQKRFNQ